MTRAVFVCICFILGTSASAEIPMRVVGPWSIEVGPGELVAQGRTATLTEAVTLEIPPIEKIAVRGERHASLPVFNPNAGGWTRGARLQRLITQECTATGLLLPETVRVKLASGEPDLFSRGADYEMDDFWATVGRVEGGAIAEGRAVVIDYDYCPCRLDSVVVDSDGAVRLIRGEPGVGVILPPTPVEGETCIGRVWLAGPVTELADENLFPINPLPPRPMQTPTQAEKFLPGTLKKLRKGEAVTILAWGDSVTNGGGVEGHPELRYQVQFVDLLRERFPQAEINLITEAWGGRGSRNYLDPDPDSPKEFVRDVLGPKADLVTIEFVNDAYLDEEKTQTHYARILGELRGAGSEVVLLTPHLVRPDWMKMETLKFDEDPRPYVKGLRRFAAENEVALADASRDWCALWREGIPYITLEANSINHPDARGHRIFAEALMDLFPEK